jgi:hypothetical protein
MGNKIKNEKIRSRGAAPGDVPRAADGKGAGLILARSRLAACDGAGLAWLKSQDLSAAWWVTPRGCAAAGDGAGRTVAASAVMGERLCRC